VRGAAAAQAPGRGARWQARAGAADGNRVQTLAAELRLPAALCTLLVQRDVGDPDAARVFLRPRMEQLHDPLLMEGMTAAVARIRAALDAGQTILVHGDYDVDGICAATLLTRWIRHVGGRAIPFLPLRMSDGYDLGAAGVRAAVEAGAELIITVDCGTTALDAIAQARHAGIDVIVTDHHAPGPTLPGAIAVLNPQRADCAYPGMGLCGAGVAFKLAQALARALGRDEAPLWHDLDLVAIATIADLAPLRGENRVLTYFGLRVLRQTRNPGLAALIDAAGLSGDALEAGTVGHVLAPRLNALGRLGDAARGVRLLLGEETTGLAALAAEADAENRRRQELDRATLEQALAMLEAEYRPERDYAVVLAGVGWHPGVIGIVASRVVERLHRPAILLAIDPATGTARGSGRSNGRFHLLEAIRACAPHLDRFGGHRQAAGLDIRADRIDAFREALNAHARAVMTADDLVPVLEYDAELELAAATPALLSVLRHLGPFGLGNPRPVFLARDVQAGAARIVGGSHLRVELAAGAAVLPAIGFGLAAAVDAGTLRGRRLDVLYQLVENRWKGRTTLEARLLDVRAAAP
jgi:single-stranded-DNA-specific exonuclease